MSKTVRSLLMAIVLFLVAGTSVFSAENGKKPNPVGFRPAKKIVPGLPKVLLVGDSICSGRSRYVIKMLDGKANIDVWVTGINIKRHNIEELQRQATEHGPYDVIHFNIGLHGLGDRIPGDQYEPLLRKYVATWKKYAPKSKLIWASTTPTWAGKVKELNPSSRPGGKIVVRNAIAAEIMKENGIVVNDLFSLVAGRLDLGDNGGVHWQGRGYEMMAEKINTYICDALGRGSAVKPTTGKAAAALPVDKMNWWKDAKFGMFVHWGVYAVPAGMYKGHQVKHIGEWILNRGKIPVAQYKEYAKEFNPVKYDPQAWVKMAKDAGMKYIVITSKHHDGFALFDSKVTDWDIVDATPYGKDLLKPLVKACRDQDMRIGFYYSQAQDWCHPGGAATRKLTRDGWDHPEADKIDQYTKAHRGHWDPVQEGDMGKYIDEIAVPQVREILSNYGKIDVLWWDTPTNMTEEMSRRFFPLIAPYPNLITNNRLGGGVKGDLETPEQYIPPTGYPGRNWEVCMTMNDTWGYKSYDHNWKSSDDLILKLSEIVSKGGNFLLNVGPTALGEIPQPSIDRLKKVGDWMKVNHDAVYGTKASPFHFLPWGRATLKGQKLYLHVLDWPEDGLLKVPVNNKAEKAYLLVDPENSLVVKNIDKRIDITIPKDAPDQVVSIVVLEFEGRIDVLPVPTDAKTGTASSSDTTTNVSNLFDGNMKNKWQAAPGEKDGWVEVDLGEPVEIGYFSIMEPWRPWHNESQKFELQVKSGSKWKKVAAGKTKGTGHSLQFKAVTGQYFRLKITGSNGKEPVLNEWILNRAI